MYPSIESDIRSADTISEAVKEGGKGVEEKEEDKKPKKKKKKKTMLEEFEKIEK